MTTNTVLIPYQEAVDMQQAYLTSSPESYTRPNHLIISVEALQNIISQVYAPLRNAATKDPITHVSLWLGLNEAKQLTLIANGARYNAETGEYVEALQPVVEGQPQSVVLYDKLGNDNKLFPTLSA